MLANNIMFISSKNIKSFEDVFKKVQHSDTVKEGENELRKMRSTEDYELCLSVYLTRSKDENGKLLAVLQLQKLSEIKNPLTVWNLKQVFLTSSAKISKIITSIICLSYNLNHVSEFLIMSSTSLGVTEAFRYLNLFSCLLNCQENFHLLSMKARQILMENILTIMRLSREFCGVQEMGLVCVILFLEYVGFEKLNDQQKLALFNGWGIKQQDVEEWVGQGVIGFVLRKYVQNEVIEEPNKKQISKLFKETFKNIGQDLPTKIFIKKTIQILQNNIWVFNFQALSTIIENHHLQSIENCYYYSQTKNTHKIHSCDIYPYQFDDDQLYQELEKLVFRVVKENQDFFGDWVERSGQRQLVGLLCLINFYPSLQQITKKQLLEPLINFTSNWLQAFPNSPSNSTAGSLQTFTFLMTFTAHHKDHYPPQRLLCISKMASKMPSQIGKLSQQCYTFIEDVWGQLALLPFYELMEFIIGYGEDLNGNQWGHCLESYGGFLGLMGYLEEGFHYLENCAVGDELVGVCLKAQEILVDLAIETKEFDNFDVLYKTIGLVSTLLKNKQIRKSHLPSLKIKPLVTLIYKYFLFLPPSPYLLAFNSIFISEWHLQMKLFEKIEKLEEEEFLFEIQFYFFLIQQLQYYQMQKNLGDDYEGQRNLGDYKRKIMEIVGKKDEGVRRKVKEVLWRVGEFGRIEDFEKQGTNVYMDIQ